MPDDKLKTPGRPTARTLCAAASGTLLFAATFAFVLWQNTHLTVLWDLSYILENATRISQGQIPYRDFPFPYAPLTFVMQATIIRLFGRVVLYHYLYAALAAGAATVLSWLILLRVLGGSRVQAFLLAAPLIFLGTGSIFPHPFYDSDCTLCIMFCAWLLLRLESKGFPRLWSFGCGLLLVAPVFIKQNTGLAFVLSAAVCIAWVGVRSWRERRWHGCALLLAGSAAGMGLGLAAIQATAGLGNYFHWTIEFAASRRLPGLQTMIGVYRDPALIWELAAFSAGVALMILPHVRKSAHYIRKKQADVGHPKASAWVGAGLMTLPFVWAFAGLFLQDNVSDRVEALLHVWPVMLVVSLAFAVWQLRRADSMEQLLPLMLLGAIHGAFLSQQLWGSTYALWPLLMILIATIIARIAPESTSRGNANGPAVAFAVAVCVTLLASGSYYALSHERLQYVDLEGDRLEHSKLPALRGLAMRGNWLPDFEELVGYSEREIPRSDAILMVPGEDLFYFTTGRVPRFPVVMMDNTVNPYSAEEMVRLARERNVQWLIVKRNLQLQEEPLSFRPRLIEMLSQEFEPVESLNNYDIFRRKQDR